MRLPWHETELNRPPSTLGAATTGDTSRHLGPMKRWHASQGPSTGSSNTLACRAWVRLNSAQPVRVFGPCPSLSAIPVANEQEDWCLAVAGTNGDSIEKDGDGVLVARISKRLRATNWVSTFRLNLNSSARPHSSTNPDDKQLKRTGASSQAIDDLIC